MKAQRRIDVDPIRRFYLLLDRCRRTNAALEDPQLSIMSRMAIRLRHVFHNKAPFCMAVSFSENGSYLLHVSKPWVKETPLKEFKVILLHEMRHIEMYDISRGLRMLRSVPEDERRAVMQFCVNPASDCSVNSQIRRFDEDILQMENAPPILPERYGLPWDKQSEWYFDKMYEMYLDCKDEAQEKTELFMQQLRSLMQQQSSGQGDEEGEGSGGQGNEEDGDEEDEQEGGGQGDEEGEEQDSDGDGDGDGDGDDEQDGQGQGGGGSNPLLSGGQDMAQNAAHIWMDFFEALNPMEQDIAQQALEQQAKSLVIDAAEEHKKSVGRLPAHYQSILDELYKEHQIPWQVLLKQHVRARLRANRRASMTRPHRRRYLYTRNVHDVCETMFKRALPNFPGRIVNKKYCVMFAIDVSGSMSEKDVLEGLSELRGMLRSMPNLSVYVVQADTSISHIDKLDEETDLKMYVKNVGRRAYGGTDFNDVLKLAAASWSRKEYPHFPDECRDTLAAMAPVDILIYHTDGYAYAPPIENKPPCNVIWLLTESGMDRVTFDSQQKFGTVIKRN